MDGEIGSRRRSPACEGPYIDELLLLCMTPLLRSLSRLIPVCTLCLTLKIADLQAHNKLQRDELVNALFLV